MSHTSHPSGPWFKDVKFSAKQLFTALGKALANVATANWGQVGASVVELVSAVSLKEKPEERAWVLIQRAMVKCIHELTRNVRRLLDVMSEIDFEDIGKRLEERLDCLPVAVSMAFLEQPKKEPFVTEMQKVYKEWLGALGLSLPVSEAEAGRLAGFYVFALREEARRHAEYYKPVFDYLSGPFAKAADRESRWNVYRAWLQRQVDQPVFDEAFSLRQIYVPLRGYYEKEVTCRDDVTDDIDADTSCLFHLVWLEQELDEWRRSDDSTYALRLLSGDPGSGKSSFAKMYADHLAEAGVCVIYVPLQTFKWKEDVAHALSDFCKRDDYLAEGVCDPKTGEPNLFVIFDGLDELAKQGQASGEAAEQFVREVRNLLTERNRNEVCLRVLICGRPLSVQSVEGELRKPGQILWVARYHYDKEATRRFENPEFLTSDQRQLWWEKFGQLTGGQFMHLPDSLASRKLDEITSQPLLNYLVALAFRRKKIDFSAEVNLNLIYADLLRAVYERAYERREDSRHMSVQLMKLKEFESVMQQVGLAAWHGNTRTTTASAIEKQCKAAGLEALLDKFREGAKLGVSRLLLAFYFQEQERREISEKAFEFTHKSFGEYLAAVAIVHALSDIHEELARRVETPGKGWDVSEALKHWVTVCGPTSIDVDLLEFVAGEVKILAKKSPDKVRKLQRTIVQLMNNVMRHGVPMQLLNPDGPKSFKTQERHARNAEMALLVAHSVCAAVTENASIIENPQVLGSWVRRLQAHAPYNYATSDIFRKAFTRLELKDGRFHNLVLSYCDLSGLNARNAYFSLTFMTGVRASKTDFSGANFFRAVLISAHCEESIFHTARLAYAILEDAKLCNVDLTTCIGDNADFYAADLTGARLVGAFLADANFQRALLRNADLRRADLRGADFRHADLSGADLRGVYLHDTRITPEQFASAKHQPDEPDPDQESIQKLILTTQHLRQARRDRSRVIRDNVT